MIFRRLHGSYEPPPPALDHLPPMVPCPYLPQHGEFEGVCPACHGTGYVRELEPRP